MTRANSFYTIASSLSAGFRGKTIASLLVVELLLAQLAIASPQLHEWMHGVDNCHHQTEHSSESSNESQTTEDHVCTIALVAEGLFHETETSEVRVSTLVRDHASEPTLLPNGPAIVRHSARSPPQS
ncbi:MAG: hypothetical protein P8L44_21620 [Opitutales bacterium]|nr:hypothetical protein [Opitutales bacterium]